MCCCWYTQWNPIHSDKPKTHNCCWMRMVRVCRSLGRRRLAPRRPLAGDTYTQWQHELHFTCLQLNQFHRNPNFPIAYNQHTDKTFRESNNIKLVKWHCTNCGCNNYIWDGGPQYCHQCSPRDSHCWILEEKKGWRFMLRHSHGYRFTESWNKEPNIPSGHLKY